MSPYWDKEKKRPTHERKCIGKISADGKEEYNEYYRNRGRMQSLEKKVREPSVVSKTTLVGQNLILDQEAKRTKVAKVLKGAFGESDAAVSASSMSTRAKNRTANHRPRKTSDRHPITQKFRP